MYLHVPAADSAIRAARPGIDLLENETADSSAVTMSIEVLGGILKKSEGEREREYLTKFWKAESANAAYSAQPEILAIGSDRVPGALDGGRALMGTISAPEVNIGVGGCWSNSNKASTQLLEFGYNTNFEFGSEKEALCVDNGDAIVARRPH